MCLTTHNTTYAVCVEASVYGGSLGSGIKQGHPLTSRREPPLCLLAANYAINYSRQRDHCNCSNITSRRKRQPYHLCISDILSVVAISTEYCDSSSVWKRDVGSTSLQSYTQPSLSSSAGKDHLQDCGLGTEMHPWRRTFIRTRILRADGESSRTFSTAVGVDWMCRPAKSADVGEPAQLRFPHADSVEVEQSAISTAWQQRVTQHVSATAEDPSVWTVMNATRAVVVFLYDSGDGYKCRDLLTYLLLTTHIIKLTTCHFQSLSSRDCKSQSKSECK